MTFDPEAYLAKKQSEPAQKSESTGFDPAEYIQKKQSAIAKGEERPWYSLDPRNLGAGFVEGLKKIDEYTAAPIRKAVTETLTGEEFSKAPTGAEQAQMLGATNVTYGEHFGLPEWVPGRNISPADIYGVGLEAIQDPFVAGAAAKKGAQLAGKGVGAIDDVVRGGSRQAAKGVQAQSADAVAESGARAQAQVQGGGLEFEQSGKLFDYKAPQSLDELREWKPRAGEGELLGKTRLEEIQSTVPDLQTKPLKYHFDMMDNPKAMKELKLKFENLPTQDAKKIAAYNQSIVDESGQKLRQSINEISGGLEPKRLGDAGDDFISVVKDKYNAEKDALAPAFEKLQKSGGKITPKESQDLIIGIGENSKLGKLLAQDETTGRFTLKKNTPRSGLSDQEHRVLARVIDDLNDGMTYKEMQDARSFLRKELNLENPAATREIEKVRSLLLGQMETMASRRGPDIAETFRGYAINERARESIEKIIGGQIESLDKMYNANPERVVKKIFANPNHADIVRGYVGEEKFKELVGSYIEEGLGKAFDPAKGFDPTKARNWINKNKDFIEKYASPEQAQRMSALADYGYYGKRFLSEVNPSGTAASLKEMIEPQGFVSKLKQGDIKGVVLGETVGRVAATVKQRQAVRALNEALGDLPEETRQNIIKTITDQIERGAQKTSSAIDKSAKASATGAAIRGASAERKFLKTGERPSDEERPVMRPLRGGEKWAQDGLKKIKAHGASLSPELLDNPKAKRLLMSASSLKPGSKAMQNLIQKLESLGGKS